MPQGQVSAQKPQAMHLASSETYSQLTPSEPGSTSRRAMASVGQMVSHRWQSRQEPQLRQRAACWSSVRPRSLTGS